MKENILRITIFVLVFLLISVLYLSTIGIKTDKFNSKIENQFKEINENLKIDLKKINIVLDPFNFNFKLKTIGTNLSYNKKIIQLENVRSIVSIKSLVNNNFSLTELNISTKPLKINNLISFIRIFKNDVKFYIAEKLIKDGYLVADLNFEFDKNGKIKDNFTINGFVKKVKIDLFKKYRISDIEFDFDFYKNDFKLLDVKLKTNNNIISIPKIIAKKKQNKLEVLGESKSKKIFLKKEDISNFIELDELLFDIKKLEFGYSNTFSFEIDNKLKTKNLRIDSKIDLKDLEISNNLNLVKIFPESKKNINFFDHQIKISLYNDKINIDGFGKILFQNNEDKIEYKIEKTKKKLKFNTQLDIIDNKIKLDLLNYQNNLKSKLELVFEGTKNKNGNYLFNRINLKDKESNIYIDDLSLNKDFQIKEFKNISLDYLDNENKKNKLNIINKDKSYYLIGQNFNASKIIDDLLKKNVESKKKIFDKDFKLNIKINKVFLDNNHSINDFNGYIKYDGNEIYEANLKSSLSEKKILRLTIKTIDSKKITTLYSDIAKPFVNRFKFIKGFDEGNLDFYSIKRKDISVSTLKIDNFKVQEIPILAKLLTLASLQGIADLLTGEGIRFTDFEMKFSNQKKLMKIDEMYAIGPAISILMEGYIESDKLTSLRGTLVPATTINRTISSIPLIGDILVGKKVGEGVFGVSFKIKGPPKDLKTTVNPIKTLTPRFITRTLEKIKKN